MKRALFIYNPYAGKAQIKTHLMDIIDILVKADYEVCAYPTQYPGDAARAAREKKKGYDLLVCSGGDGTLDEVVKGMMQCSKKIPIGYIPAGSTNDFANSLCIPKNMSKSAKTVVEGHPFSCDVGAFNDDFFVYIAAFGLFTDVSYETQQEMKNMLGHFAYIIEGMNRLPNMRSYHLKVTSKDTVIEDDFIFGMVTNSTSVGGFKRITGKYVELNDGLFEVTLIKTPKNPIELSELMGALVVRDTNSDRMYCFKTDELTVESKEEMSWTLDGEFGGSCEKAVIKNIKEAIQIIVPQEKQ